MLGSNIQIMTTRNEILTALRRRPLTVAEIGNLMGVTRNAVIVQLKQLEAAGLVRPTVTRREGGKGKPAMAYEATQGSEDVESTAYRPFLGALMAVLRSKLSGETLSDIMVATGERLAQEAGLDHPQTFEDGLKAAMAVADSLGAKTEAVPYEGGIMIQNFCCPVGSTAREDGCVCQALAAFFATATGRPTLEHCLRNDRLICQYHINLTKDTDVP
jgi:predicted ArsR family transcriptional regulator